VPQGHSCVHPQHVNKQFEIQGIIVDGALRSSSKVATLPYSVRARAAHPKAFMPGAGAPEGETEIFAFSDGQYVVGDGDGLIVLPNANVMRRLGFEIDDPR
jgi:regulator of RNase E activity RraA